MKSVKSRNFDVKFSAYQNFFF